MTAEEALALYDLIRKESMLHPEFRRLVCGYGDCVVLVTCGQRPPYYLWGTDDWQTYKAMYAGVAFRMKEAEV